MIGSIGFIKVRRPPEVIEADGGGAACWRAGRRQERERERDEVVLGRERERETETLALSYPREWHLNNGVDLACQLHRALAGQLRRPARADRPGRRCYSGGCLPARMLRRPCTAAGFVGEVHLFPAGELFDRRRRGGFGEERKKRRGVHGRILTDRPAERIGGGMGLRCVRACVIAPPPLRQGNRASLLSLPPREVTEAFVASLSVRSAASASPVLGIRRS